MVNDNYEGTEIDKETIRDGGGVEKSKTNIRAKLKEKNIRAERIKSHERAMNH